MYLTNFFFETENLKVKNKNKIRSLIKSLCLKENKKLGFINCIFCSDEYLGEINKKYLGHDYYTDIITFDHKDTEDNVEGDLYISSERIKENAKNFGVKTEEELIRVVIHGVLHLIGYKDKSKKEKMIMTQKENKYISLYKEN